MTKDFTDLKSLFRHLEKQATKVLINDVANVAKEEMSQTIKEEVYKSYSPTEYERREDDGGLSDVRNMVAKPEGNNEISIRNMTTGSGDDYSQLIDQIIVYGQGYTWEESEIYKMQPFPRDFYKMTAERLKGNQKHLTAFKAGMTKLGFKID